MEPGKCPAESKRPEAAAGWVRWNLLTDLFEKELPGWGQKLLLANIKKMFIVVSPCGREIWRLAAQRCTDMRSKGRDHTIDSVVCGVVPFENARRHSLL
jgi:hypothetical protein